MGGLKTWEKIPVLMMILSILLSPVRVWAEGIHVQLGFAEVDAFDEVAEIETFDPGAPVATGPVYVEYANSAESLVPGFAADTVSKITPHPFDSDADILLLFKSPTDTAPMGVAVSAGGTAVVPCVTTATIEVFSAGSGADAVGAPVATPAGSTPWMAGFIPGGSTVFISNRGVGILTLDTAAIAVPVSTPIPVDPLNPAAVIPDPLDVEITPSGAVGWMPDFDPAAAASLVFGFGGGKRITRFSTAAPATQIDVDIDAIAGAIAGPWGLTVLPSGTDIFIFCNSGHCVVAPNDEAGAVVATTEASLLAGDVAGDTFLGIALWDGDATDDSGKVFLTAHHDVLGPAPDAPGPSPGAEPSGLFRIFTVAGTGKFTSAAPVGPTSVDVTPEAFEYDVAIRPPVAFVDTTLGRRKSGGHACYVGKLGPEGSLPVAPLALLGLGVVYCLAVSVRRRDAELSDGDTGILD